MPLQFRYSVIAFALLFGGPVVAQGPASPDAALLNNVPQDIYGYDLMTSAERDAYLSGLNEARSAEERQRFVDEHQQRMRDRARERGVTLPDQDDRLDRDMSPGGVRDAVPAPRTTPPGAGGRDWSEQSRDDAVDRLRRPQDNEQQLRDPTRPVPGSPRPPENQPPGTPPGQPPLP